MNTTTRPRRSARWHAEQIAASNRQAIALRELADHALRLGLTYEHDRLTDSADHLDIDADARI